MEAKYREVLLSIGAQHPANGKPGDILVDLFNRMTADAREAVGAKGASDDAKADWCSRQIDELRGGVREFVWIIKDWAGNHKFLDKEFDSFGDGWDFLASQFDDDADLGEFGVVRKAKGLTPPVVG